jgi:hypothetical protein
VVLSGGKRQITDDAVAIERLHAAGWTDEQVTRTLPLTLGDLERIVGKDQLPEILGNVLARSSGKKSLAPEDDARPSITPESDAARDFS